MIERIKKAIGVVAGIAFGGVFFCDRNGIAAHIQSIDYGLPLAIMALTWYEHGSTSSFSYCVSGSPL